MDKRLICRHCGERLRWSKSSKDWFTDTGDFSSDACWCSGRYNSPHDHEPLVFNDYLKQVELCIQQGNGLKLPAGTEGITV